jgi:hypothetical protein
MNERMTDDGWADDGWRIYIFPSQPPIKTWQTRKQIKNKLERDSQNYSYDNLMIEQHILDTYAAKQLSQAATDV